MNPQMYEQLRMQYQQLLQQINAYIAQNYPGQDVNQVLAIYMQQANFGMQQQPMMQPVQQTMQQQPVQYYNQQPYNQQNYYQQPSQQYYNQQPYNQQNYYQQQPQTSYLNTNNF
jgi:hypothetical protein